MSPEKTSNRRLAKLFELVTSGSTTYGVKKTATNQIFQYFTHHPDELASICDLVAEALLSKSWETRQVSAQLIDLLAQSAHAFANTGTDSTDHFQTDLFTFASIDLETIVQQGKPLFSCAGKEFDIDLDGMTPKERISFQRKQLKERLGFAEAFGAAGTEFVEDEDLMISTSPATASLEDQAQLIDMSQLSARERVQMKRRMKKLKAGDLKRKPTPVKEISAKSPVEQEQSQDDFMKLWPFYNLCESMLQNLFSPNWHVRQGACMGLKSLFKTRLFEFNEWYRIAYQNSSELGPIEDLLVRLNCLLALDRFADFVQTQAAAVVRESCGQLIATVCHCLLEKKLEKFTKQEISHLTTLIKPTMDWQVRFSGLVGLKYLLCLLDGDHWIDKELEQSLLSCLEFDDEDVCSLACEIFIQISGKKSNEQKQNDRQIFSILTNHVANVLSAEEYELSDIATSNSMTFIIQLICNYWDVFGTAEILGDLLKFIRHPSISVRQACIKIIAKVLVEHAEMLARYLVEFVILEESAGLKQEAGKLLEGISINQDNLLQYVFPILFTPLLTPFQRSNFISVAPFSLDLFFKNSDLLLHDAEFLRTSRVVLCNSIKSISGYDDSRIFPALYQTFEQKMSILLILLATNIHSLHLIQELDDKDFAATFEKTEQKVVALECCYLYQVEGRFRAAHVKILLNALKEESVAVLQHIFAKTVSNWIISTCNKKLVSLVVSLFSSNVILCPDLNTDSKIYIYSLTSSTINDSNNLVDCPSRGADFVIENICKSNQSIDLFVMIEELFFQQDIPSLLLGIAACRSLLGHSELVPNSKLEKLASFLSHPNPVIRYATCNSFTCLPLKSFGFLIESVLAMIEQPDYTAGVVELIYVLVRQGFFSQTQVLPFVLFFVSPVLKCLNHSNPDIRTCAYQSFSLLLGLVSLFNFKQISKDPFDGQQFSDGTLYLQRAVAEYSFLEQLFDLKLIAQEEIVLPTCLKVPLRPYQTEGIKWLQFLRKYNLNGALCDDMGLGKTLQTLVAIFTSSQGSTDPHPSLIVCPATLIGHWENETLVHFKGNLVPIPFAGSLAERRKQRHLLTGPFPRGALIIASYDTVRNDFELFSQIQLNYCVLDEGHLIKNSKTKLSQSIKQLKSAHRLLLSGTPIQNNVLELWSLFDFLMPGFLGTESWFNARYAKAIQSSRDAKSASEEFEAAERALGMLHRQTLPFILRRLKEDVLKDLPPKTIQDYPIEMSQIQRTLYNKYANSIVTDQQTQGSGKGSIFKTLQFLARISLHPSLLFDSFGEYRTYLLKEKLITENEQTDFVSGSPKLLALKELLQECNVDIPLESLDEDPHRLLIFAQHKSSLDIIEQHVLVPHFPSLQYFRLDGGVPTELRFKRATQFNSDPAVRVMLLTTQVGGLGLNLVGADTVIFFEHDWNPQKDLQAMDRAHRLGQQRTVNVYRLIMKDSIEERIMGSQKFKLHIAGSVINQQNVAISSMCKTSGDEENDQLDVAELLCLQARDSNQPKKTSERAISLSELIEQVQTETSNNDEQEELDSSISSFQQFLKQHQ